MNKLIKVIKSGIVLSSIIVVASCAKEDFDIPPTNQDSEASVFVEEATFRKVVDGSYDAMKGLYSGDDGNAVITADVLGDNLIQNTTGRLTNGDAYEWGYSAGSGSVTNFYFQGYFVISRANFALANLDKLPSTPFMKNIEAEAKAIRGFMHFQIARAHSKIPTQSSDANSSLGIAYVTEFNPAQKPARDATVAESYSKIVSDLEFAYANINVTNGSTGRFNKISVAAALSEVYLLMGDYPKAAQYGEIVISQSPSVGTLSTFPFIWTDVVDTGVLFKLQNANASYDNFIVGVAYNQNSGGIKSEFNVTYDLFTKYQSNDVRKSSYLLTAPYSGQLFNHIIKYRTRQGSSVAGLVDVKVLRTAEVYLNTAEAYLRASSPNPTRALTLLNTLRSNRYNGFVPGTETGTALLDATMLERRLELAFEDDRFWTIKRLGQSVTRNSTFGQNANGTGTPPPAAIITLPANSPKFQLPIPLTEMNLNPNMQQNPGY